MGVTSYSVADQIALAYSAKISVVWDFEAETKRSQEKIRKYCPACKKFNTLVEVKPQEDEEEALKYKCRSCGHRCKNPASLNTRGGSFGESCRSTRVGRGSGGNKLVNAMSNSMVVDAVESQPTAIKSWLLWVYTDPDETTRDNLEGVVMSELAGRIDKIESEALKGLTAYGKVFRVMQLMMNDFRKARRMGQPGKAKPSAYAAEVGVDRSQFSSGRMWHRIMWALIREMQDIDNTALTNVEEILW